MATIRRRRGKYQAQVRRKGEAPLSKTFTTRQNAKAWAERTESALEAREASGAYLPVKTLGELLTRYRDAVTPRKRGAYPETCKLNVLIRSELGELPLAALRAEPFALYRDKRLAACKPATVCTELGLIQHALKTAENDWGWTIPHNPLPKIARPRFNNARYRRLSPTEERVLLEACRSARNWWLEPIVVLAIETAMRRGEILSAKRRDFDKERGLLQLHDTKNGERRLVPLTPRARSVLTELPEGGDTLFPITSNAFKLSWVRAVRRSGLENFRFHDLRHEAISRFFELGLGVPEVALISGHKDVRMLFRYTHMQAERIVEKLNAT